MRVLSDVPCVTRSFWITWLPAKDSDFEFSKWTRGCPGSDTSNKIPPSKRIFQSNFCQKRFAKQNMSSNFWANICTRLTTQANQQTNLPNMGIWTTPSDWRNEGLLTILVGLVRILKWRNHRTILTSQHYVADRFSSRLLTTWIEHTSSETIGLLRTRFPGRVIFMETEIPIMSRDRDEWPFTEMPSLLRFVKWKCVIFKDFNQQINHHFGFSGIMLRTARTLRKRIKNVRKWFGNGIDFYLVLLFVYKNIKFGFVSL